jgi:peroxiredoxin
MVQTLSTLSLPLGTRAPDFRLRDPAGKTWSRQDFAGSPLLVAFICNHCPFVKHVRHVLAALAEEYRGKGVAVVGINSNDAASHPEDSPERMAEEIRSIGYTFPYLIDETQEVAKAYRAACTPDFFVFDRDHALAYTGRMDGSRPGNDVPVTGADLRGALDAVLDGRTAPAGQPSMGCNIKWKAGREPDYFKA